MGEQDDPGSMNLCVSIGCVVNMADVIECENLGQFWWKMGIKRVCFYRFFWNYHQSIKQFSINQL